MVRAILLFILLFITALMALIASRLPGKVVIEGYSEIPIEMAPAFAGLMVILMCALLSFSFWILIKLINLPGYFRRRNAAIRVKRSNMAITDGLLAAHAGDGNSAERHAQKASAFAEDDRLALLLEARIAEENADWIDAERVYSMLALKPGATLAALKGLVSAAMKRQDRTSAIARCKEALALKSEASWPFHSLFELQLYGADWAGAIQTLQIGEKRQFIEVDIAKRCLAALKTAKAIAVSIHNPEEADQLLAEVARSHPDFPVANYHAARRLFILQKPKPALNLLIKAWAKTPHPSLAILARDALLQSGNDNAFTQLESLIKANPDHRESTILKAQLMMDRKNWSDARIILQPLLQLEVSTRLCRLMEHIARNLGDDADAYRWSHMAFAARKEPNWDDIIPEGTAFTYSDEEWASLVYTYGNTGKIIHPEYESSVQDWVDDPRLALVAPEKTAADAPSSTYDGPIVQPSDYAPD